MDYRIGVSDAMVDLLIQRGFPPERFFAIYNGIDFTPAPPQGDRLEYLRGLGAEVDGDSVVIGIAARLNPVKDMSTLIRGLCGGIQELPAASACDRGGRRGTGKAGESCERTGCRTAGDLCGLDQRRYGPVL